MRTWMHMALAITATVAYAAVAVAIGFGWMADKSFAQVASQTVVDIRPFVNEFVIPFMTTVALALGSYILIRLRRWLGIQDNDKLASLADDALRNAVTYAENIAKSKIESGDWARIDVRNKVVAQAVGYVQEQIPATLKKLGFDPATPEGRAAIERMVVARLPLEAVPDNLSSAPPPAPASHGTPSPP